MTRSTRLGGGPALHRLAHLRAGLTLLELVVALTITGIATSAGYAAFATLADRRAVARERSTTVARAAALRGTLVTWLSAARLTIEEDDVVFRGVDGLWRARPGDRAAADDELTFFTTASTSVSDAGTIVRLRVDRSDSTAERGLVAELSAWNGRCHARLELAPEVEAMDAVYLSSLFGQQQWLPSWVSSTLLPAGVRLTLTSRGDATVAPLLAVPITVSLEGGR